MSSLDLIPDPSATPDDELSRWLAVADRLAEALRPDVVRRDRENALPHAQIALFREAGLLDLTVATRFGGQGASWRTALQVVRRIARTDAPVAQILGYHYAWLRIIDVVDTETAQQTLRDTVQHRWLWAGAGTSRLGLAQLKPAQGHAGYIGQASAAFATGAPVADRILVRGVDTETQRFVLAVADPRAPQFRLTDDWDVLGQRQSASHSVAFDDLPIAPADVLGVFAPLGQPTTPRMSLGVLFFQSLFTHLHLGIAEGALLEAADYVRDKARPWAHATVEKTTDDPFVQNAFGDYTARLQAVSALAERADRAVGWLVDHKDEITAQQRTQVAEIVASAKIVSIQAGLETTSHVFDLTGAKSTGAAFGLDRFWRNLRTMSLHDPLAYKLNEVGRYVLNGEAPEPSGYR